MFLFMHIAALRTLPVALNRLKGICLPRLGGGTLVISADLYLVTCQPVQEVYFVYGLTLFLRKELLKTYFLLRSFSLLLTCSVNTKSDISSAQFHKACKHKNFCSAKIGYQPVYHMVCYDWYLA